MDESLTQILKSQGAIRKEGHLKPAILGSKNKHLYFPLSTEVYWKVAEVGVADCVRLHRFVRFIGVTFFPQ